MAKQKALLCGNFMQDIIRGGYFYEERYIDNDNFFTGDDRYSLGLCDSLYWIAE